MKPFSFKDAASRFGTGGHHYACSTSFNCSLEHNRNTSCSIIKMFDIIDDRDGDEDPNGSQVVRERVSKFLREHLFDAFNFLPSSDLKRYNSILCI